LHDCSKEYIADIKLGEATDTYDAEGRITSSTDPGYVILPAIEQALVCFQGDIEQTPPAYSALKIGGRRSYEMARAGIAVHHKPRRVTIHRIHVVHFELPLVKLMVRCSSGTYIRSLAHDLGIKLGCGAHLENLVRSAYGPFKLEDAVSPAILGSTCLSGNLENLLYPPDYPVYGWFKQVVDSETAIKIGRGQDVQLGCNAMDGNGLATVYTEDGKLVAVMKFMPGTGRWHPHKVFTL
jgi:tRNA pseudouridine55 synthase